MPVTPRRLLATFLACALAAATGSARAEGDTSASPPPPAPDPVAAWRPGDPIPPGFTEVLGARRRERKGGLVALLLPYSLGLAGASFVGLGNGPSRYNWLLLPGAGPIVLLAKTTNPVGNVVLALDGLSQLSGIALIAYAIASPEPALVREKAFAFTVVPLVGQGSSGASGLSVVGSF